MVRKVLRVARPCGRSWDQLAGEGSARHCAECGKVVHDLDALSVDQVRALIRQNPTGFCATYLTDQTGEFVVREPPSFPSRVAVAATLLVASLSGCAGDRERSAKPKTSVGSPSPDASRWPVPGQCAKVGPSPTPPVTLSEEQKEQLRALGYVAG